GGRAAAEKIHSMDMSAPVLFATGYDKPGASNNKDDIHMDKIIEKPFSIETLSSKITRLINA
ncbi:MAG: hypothetical protein Q9M12_08600, partial [Mariprofundus sp.]|nr:hypothetical protein [Mariprofundus sp.]